MLGLEEKVNIFFISLEFEVTHFIAKPLYKLKVEDASNFWNVFLFKLDYLFLFLFLFDLFYLIGFTQCWVNIIFLISIGFFLMI